MLEIRSISKRYGDRQVLNNASFDVKPGRLTGFVGGNGAGKTTTMRTILGLVHPDGGEVLLDGAPLTVRDRARFGYMPEERGLYPKMKVLEQIVYFAELHGLDTERATKNAKELLAELQLDERANDKLEELSLGNQQRVQIAVTLAHDPEFLILDEPFSGLDPDAVETVLGVLQRFAGRNVPVLFSSHQLDVVERLSDELVIIAAGEIKARGSREELQDHHSRGMYRIETTADAGWVREVPGIQVLDFDMGTALVYTENPDNAQRLLRIAMERGPVISFGPYKEKLSNIYKEVTA